jgi:histidyl-tRNA synthetase
MFRYERPQAGRYRQFHQLDVEALGEPHPALDAEVIAMLVDFFGALGLAGRLDLHVNSIGDPATRPAYTALLVAYLEPHAARLCSQCRERLVRNPLRVLDCKVPDCQPVIDRAPSILDSLPPEAREHFETVRAELDAMGIAYTVDPRLVRGLDYYVRTTFELKTKDLGAQDAVAGGGRYDGLIKQLGGPADPGIGFAVGMERVVLLLAQADDGTSVEKPQVALIPLGEASRRRLLPIARSARQAGIALELGYGARKLPRALERANRLRVRWAVIVGDDELSRDEAVLREMASGEQRQVALSSLGDELRALVRGDMGGEAR